MIIETRSPLAELNREHSRRRRTTRNRFLLKGAFLACETSFSTTVSASDGAAWFWDHMSARLRIANLGRGRADFCQCTKWARGIASKHAVLDLTNAASIELFKQGVRVNAINPSIIDLPFQDRVWPSAEVKEAFAASTVPGRAGSAEETAAVVGFLASDGASFISGHGLLIDGGYSIA